MYLTYHGFMVVPTGFIPDQDTGYLLANIHLPDSASLERTSQVMAQVDQIVLDTPGVGHSVGIVGQSILLNAMASNAGTMFIVLEEFEKRHDLELYSTAIARRLSSELNQKVPDAVIGVFGPPPVDGLGDAGGFKLMLQDRCDMGTAAL